MQQSATRSGFSIILAVLQERVFILKVDPNENMKGLLNKCQKNLARIIALCSANPQWPLSKQPAVAAATYARIMPSLRGAWGFVVVGVFQSEIGRGFG